MSAHRIADAVTAGWRVYGFVTPVVSRSVVVTAATVPKATKGSPDMFCESPSVTPVQPSASAWRAVGPTRRGGSAPGSRNRGGPSFPPGVRRQPPPDSCRSRPGRSKGVLLPSRAVRLGIATPIVVRFPGTHAEWERDAGIAELTEIAVTGDRLGYHHLG